MNSQNQRRIWRTEAYVTLGRAREAERISTWLREIGSRLDRPALIGDVARIEALAAAEAGDLGTAAERAQAAVEAHGQSPLRPELASSLLVLGRIERRRRARKRSRATLRRALELATQPQAGRTRALRAPARAFRAERVRTYDRYRWHSARAVP
jgi:hypothetical protein